MSLEAGASRVLRSCIEGERSLHAVPEDGDLARGAPRLQAHAQLQREIQRQLLLCRCSRRGAPAPPAIWRCICISRCSIHFLFLVSHGAKARPSTLVDEVVRVRSGTAHHDGDAPRGVQQLVLARVREDLLTVHVVPLVGKRCVLVAHANCMRPSLLDCRSALPQHRSDFLLARAAFLEVAHLVPSVSPACVLRAASRDDGVQDAAEVGVPFVRHTFYVTRTRFCYWYRYSRIRTRTSRGIGI